MFEVLVFVYENYWREEVCPEPAHLERKLHAVGFEPDEIAQALTWLGELNLAARGLQQATTQEPGSNPAPALTATALAHASPHSRRFYTSAEQSHLGAPCLGLICFLEDTGVLPAHMREIVLERAMAAPDGPVPLDDLKTIILMVYWSLGQQPDALVLDELCGDNTGRAAH